MLSIKDSIVANTLMDQRYIESILLLPDRDVGREVIEKSSHLDPNCKEAFLPNGDQLIGKPSFRSYACPHREPRILASTNEALIISPEVDLSKLEAQLLEKKAEISVLENERTKLEEQRRQLSGIGKQRLSLAKMQLENRLANDLKDLDALRLSKNKRVNSTVFEEEISSCADSIVELADQLKTAEERLATFVAEHQQLDDKLNEMRVEYSAKFGQIEEQQLVLKDLEVQLASHRNDVDFHQEQVDNLIAKEAVQTDEISNDSAQLEAMIEEAGKISPRIATNESVSDLNTQITTVEEQIQAAQNKYGNVTAVKEQIVEMEAKYNQIKEVIQKQRAFLDKLKEAWGHRQEIIRKFQVHRALLISQKFSTYLANRILSGELIFNHKDQMLNIVVHSDTSKGARNSKDTRNLSGGEKSFTTISFLMSLWSIAESPILFLDEFDVFMDEFNRMLAVDVILKSVESLNAQCVFITPQNLGSIKPSKNLKIFRFPNPKKRPVLNDLISEYEYRDN